jgi:hypothetical protein
MSAATAPPNADPAEQSDQDEELDALYHASEEANMVAL